MPLSGKSYWAKKLSEELNIPFVDTDVIIESECRKPVATIFETEGEAVFRRFEKEVLDNIIAENKTPLIVACGGGTPVFNDNITAMKKEGCVIYLKANVITLTQRFENTEEQNGRPLLASITDIEIELETLLEERKYIYEQADYTIDVSDASVSNFEQIIQSCTGRH
jgi:shikimate kinase